MSTEKIEIVRGGGNLFRDLGLDNPELRWLAPLAREYLKLVRE